MGNNKICKICNEPITEKSYPCGVDNYGNYTCNSCNYKEIMKNELPKICLNIETFLKNRNSNNERWDDAEWMLVELSKSLATLNENDIQTINYVVSNAKERI